MMVVDSFYTHMCVFLPALVHLEQRFRLFTDGDLNKVVSCMEHAISAVHPRTRYSPGWDAKFFWLPLSYVPTCFTDSLFINTLPRPHALC